jgi:DNA-binding NarL/FixJ family response regulator
MMREGLKALIQMEPDLAVVGEAGNGRETLALVKELRAQLVIMDISMPDLNGIEAARKIKRAHPACRVLALSGHAEPQVIREMFKAGAAAYVLKTHAYEDLVRAIHAVQAGKLYLSGALSQEILLDFLNHPAATGSKTFAVLSPREREVLQLIAEGHNSKAMASILQRSIKTVEGFRAKLMRKLNLHSVAELTKYAVREKLTTM